MIHYQLRCDGEHAFDGWFRDSTAFAAQSEAGLLCCPQCGSAAVKRALMAPAIGRKRAAPAQVAPAPPAPATAGREVAAAGMPDGVRAALQRIRAEVEKTCTHVGPAFAEEARRIHNGEVEPRGIYGDATPEEAAALEDDGIAVARIPWVPRADG